MARPERTFSGQEGQRSTGTAGPEAIKRDLDSALAMFNPEANLPDGSQGGIGDDNLKPGAATDMVVGDRTIDDEEAPTSSTGGLGVLLSRLANRIKAIMGVSSWRGAPPITLQGAKAHVDAAAPHSGHETPAGAQAKANAAAGGVATSLSEHVSDKKDPHDVGSLIKAGTGIAVSKHPTSKEVTITAQGGAAPGAHASTHAMGGADPITPEMIGAATTSQLNNHVNNTSNPHGVTKSQVGLGNVDNVKQATKTEFDAHVNATNNPHGVTKAQVGLGNVPNNAMASKAQAEAGTSNSRFMSPLRTKEATDKYISGTGDGSIALGTNASAEGGYSTALGYNASAEGGSSTALGDSASASRGYSIALGYNASAEGGSSTALGDSASASGITSTALGDSASASENWSTALGGKANADNARQGVLGGQDTASTNNWLVPGSFTVSGSKNFEIPHPHPNKRHTHMLRHGAVESPTAGDTLYRFTVESTEDNETVSMELPDYFQHLNVNVDVWVNGQGHFGNGYGWVEDGTLYVACELAGEYKVLVIGTRNDDHQSIQDWHIKGVEREIGESWTGETWVFDVEEIMEIEEIKEEE